MQELRQMTTREEVEEFTQTLWRTPEFLRSSREPGGFVKKWVDLFSERPRFCLSSSEPGIETSQFYSWMNALSLREYQNPVISDVYYLHEIVHIATMDYRPRLTFDTWKAKMVANETYASLESEVLVYFALPSLREGSFDFEIWADRFLLDKSRLVASLGNQELFTENFPAFYRTLRARRVAISQTEVSLRDPVEQVIALYARQNDLWAEIWRDSRSAIEDALSRFNALSDLDRTAGADFFREWLEKDAARGDGVPFRAEAELFSVIYHLKKKADQQVYDKNPKPQIWRGTP